jgi:hypothetical protein
MRRRCPQAINAEATAEARSRARSLIGGTSMIVTIHSKTIELDEDLGVAEGQDVEVQVKIVQPARKWGEGILGSAGGWVDYPEMDTIMEKIHQDRKLEWRPQMDNE